MGHFIPPNPHIPKILLDLSLGMRIHNGINFQTLQALCSVPGNFFKFQPPSGPTHWPGGPWYKINSSPVCFGSKDSAFGRFYIKQNMTVTAIKLVHLSGYVTCNDKLESARSNWGCGFYTTGGNVTFEDRLYTIITDHQDHKIFPQDEFIKSFQSLSYNLPGGITSKSPELFFTNFTPMNVTAGQEYRIWYGQDLINRSEDNNEGNVCAEVYLYGKQL